ncbi:MAG TPA: hypothetical protein VHY33_15670 [Thermoanaerobaculia bacterium]|jgi:photosystem II stability/assembly factor-like uncharacterized protein|nr:hypothetical protein [Thermoanaerobaculia bacterium]
MLSRSVPRVDRPTIEARFDDPDAAAEYFAMKRGITADVDVNARYAAARARIDRMPRLSLAQTDGSRVHAESLFTSGGWTFLGPGNIGGRTGALLIDPNDPNTMYAAAVSGGVWKTTTAGANWTATGDAMANLAVNSLAFDPSNPRVIYAGTGEGYFREVVRGTALPIRGNGIFVTSDAGATWQQLSSTNNSDFDYVNDLTVSTHDPHRLYAATRSGIWRSSDSGLTWSRVLPAPVNGGCLDLAFRADTNNDYLLASCGTFAQATVYRNAAAETNAAWDAVLTETDMGRTSLAFAQSNPSVAYALAASNAPGPGGRFTQGLFAVYRSDDGGATWHAQLRNTSNDHLSTLLLTNPVTDPASDCGGTSPDNMGWYSNVIAVDPRDENRVWAAGVDLFRSDDGGRSFRLASFWWASTETSFAHSDQHVIVFDPRYDGVGNQTMFAANDGGITRTDNSRAALSPDICSASRSSVVFHSLNHNYGATQFYNGQPFPGGTVVLGGTQDNGTLVGGPASPDGWDRIFGGDGGYVAIDPIDQGIMYVESQHAHIQRLPAGAELTLPGDTLFITPFILDPNDRTRLWSGARTVSRHTGNAWITASTQLDGQVSALAVTPGNSNAMLAGTNSGSIYRTTKATTATSSTAWTASKPRDGFVSSITIAPNVVYATYAGFGGTHVWRSLDGGAAWQPLDGEGEAALPDIPVHALSFDAAHLYIGTDLGIFISTDGGAHWFAEASFPRVITESIALGNGPRGPALFAFTHGRGAWRVDLAPVPRRRAAR